MWQVLKICWLVSGKGTSTFTFAAPKNTNMNTIASQERKKSFPVSPHCPKWPRLGALLLERHATSHNAIRLLHSSPRKAPGGAASRICRQPVPRQSPHCSGSKPHAPASLCSLQPSRHEGRRGNFEKILTMMILLMVMMTVTIKLST